MGEALSDLFEQADMVGGTLPEDLFSILETFEDTFSSTKERASIEGSNFSHKVATQLVSSSQVGSNSRPFEAGDEGQAPKKRKLDDSPRAPADSSSQDGQQKTSHITVERNRRKQMNEHLSVLRSLMPCFYTKRGDQASIIGGVVDYIKELQQVLQSLEAKKQRKTYSEVLSPRPAVCSSPRPPPLSPRMALPISPRTPQPGSPYMPRIQPQQQPQQGYLSPAVLHVAESSPSFNSAAAATATTNAEIVAASNSEPPVAKVEVKFSGPNVILKTISHRIPGQAFKIITALESLAMEILHVSISTNVNDDIMLNSFTIKIGIECELSAEELAQEIQQTFL